MSHKFRNAYPSFEMECPECYDSLSFQPVLKPDATADYYLGSKPCAMCGTVLEVNYRKDINTVVATVKEQAQ